MMRRPARFVCYLLSLPERLVRAGAAVGGGALYELTQLLPGWVRRSRLYHIVVLGSLRIAVELVGGVGGVVPTGGVDAGTLALRKAAGTGIELLGLAAIGWSPLWLLAAAADLTGGTRAYLRALVAELQQNGLLPDRVDITSIDGLLNALEGTSGLMADTIDRPPLRVDDLRGSWGTLRQNVALLPTPARLNTLYTQLRQVASQEGRSLWSVSSLIAGGAMRAGLQLGQSHIFDYYRDALQTILDEGLPAYLLRVSRPYRQAAGRHLDPRQPSHTERRLGCAGR